MVVIGVGFVFDVDYGCVVCGGELDCGLIDFVVCVEYEYDVVGCWYVGLV